MTRQSSPGIRTLVVLAVLGVALLAQGCALEFTGDNYQRLKTFFELTETLVQGDAAVVHTWFFPASVGVRKRWIQVSGRATAPDGGTLPATATVVARFADLETDRQQQKVTLKLKIKAGGTFSAKKKIKKDISADSLMMVTLMPAGHDLEEGTELTLCVDVAKTKGALKGLPACVASGAIGGTATLTQLQNEFFTPTCDSFGCHNTDTASAGLVLASGMSFSELVNVPSSGVPQFNRVEPGDPENSYLVKKLRGDVDIDGVRMPEGGPFLTDAELARIISWINDGAPNN